MSFYDDQRAKILRITEQMSFEYVRVLDTVPGTVGLAEMNSYSPALPARAVGRRAGGREGGGEGGRVGQGEVHSS